LTVFLGVHLWVRYLYDVDGDVVGGFVNDLGSGFCSVKRYPTSGTARNDNSSYQPSKEEDPPPLVHGSKLQCNKLWDEQAVLVSVSANQKR
jgi:hypothetical protein